MLQPSLKSRKYVFIFLVLRIRTRLPSTVVFPVSKFIVPDWGYTVVDFSIRLSYQAASLCSLAGNPMPELTLSSQSGTMNLATHGSGSGPTGLGPKWTSPIGSFPFHRAQKNSGIPGPNPLPLPHVMDMHASKTLCTGLYKS
jgi:hypothetical protein